MSSQRIHLLGLSSNPAWRKRVQMIADDLKFNVHFISSIEECLETDKFSDARMIILDSISVNKKEEITGLVQVARQVAHNSYIMIVLDKKIPPDIAQWVKKSGASLVLMENDFFEHSKLEFVISQVIRASLLPVKVSEFIVDSDIDFNLYYLMPLNQKILPVVQKGTKLSENKLKKLETVGELYINRDEVEAYAAYTAKYKDMSANGLKSRCRAQYLAFCKNHADLVYLLMDQSEQASFQKGKDLYEKCQTLARDLLTGLSAVGEPWEVVNNSSIGEFGSIERSPAIAAYAGLVSLSADIGDPVKVMSAALLADIGMMQLSPMISKKMRDLGSADSLLAEEVVDFQKHPLFSVNHCLSRKLPLDDDIKAIIMNTHERMDLKGFPNRPVPEKIPMEAMLLQLCDVIDQASLVKMGSAKPDIRVIRKEVVQNEFLGTRFSPDLLKKVQTQL